MKKLLSMTMLIASLAMIAGCGPKEAETPSDALESKKMTMPGAAPADLKNIDPSMREEMRKQMGRLSGLVSTHAGVPSGTPVLFGIG